MQKAAAVTQRLSLARRGAKQRGDQRIARHRTAVHADRVMCVVRQDVEVAAGAGHALFTQAWTLLARRGAFAFWLANGGQECFDAFRIRRNLVDGLAQVGGGAFDVAGQFDDASFAQVADILAGAGWRKFQEPCDFIGQHFVRRQLADQLLHVFNAALGSRCGTYALDRRH
jgi:hypothetical protein